MQLIYRVPEPNKVYCELGINGVFISTMQISVEDMQILITGIMGNNHYYFNDDGSFVKADILSSDSDNYTTSSFEDLQKQWFANAEKNNSTVYVLERTDDN